jgi:coenzyme F420-reducing hydrogenase gamma subunit
MTRPRVAIFDLACCEGCQLQIVNMEEDILQLLNAVDLVEWREGISDQSEHYEIAIVEGSVTRPEDEERLRNIREHADVLIALGACAVIGGINKLKNNFTTDEVRSWVYGAAADMPHLETAAVRSLDEVVEVDVQIPGCPIDAQELSRVVRSLLVGKAPFVPTYPVCVECKMNENGCRFDYGEVCLGPVTRAGCDARCPSNGTWCFGCRGLIDKANLPAAREVMDRHGRTFEDLTARMLLFAGKLEALS